MVRLGALLRRSRNKAEEPEAQAPIRPSIDTPPLVVMIPDGLTLRTTIPQYAHLLMPNLMAPSGTMFLHDPPPLPLYDPAAVGFSDRPKPRRSGTMTRKPCAARAARACRNM